MLNEILSRLQNVRKTSNGWIALCPSHDDKKQSLSVKESDGKVLLKCFAGCDAQTIVSALGFEWKDLFSGPIRQQAKTKNNFKQNKIISVYPYADETGKLLYENVRFEPKDFRQRRFDDKGKEIWNLDGTRRVPYRLPELLKALSEVADVWLCEGEKDADNLRSLGLTASSFKNWKPEFNLYLKNTHVCLIQDHDEAGIKQATDAAKLLSGNVASLRTIDFYQDEPLPKNHGKDFSDWFESEKQNGLDNDEIAELFCILTDYADAPTEETEETNIKLFPVPNEKCFYGLAGDFVRLFEPNTEADKMALLVQFLVYFGNIIGRSAHYKVEGDFHYTNLFCILVGKTAQGRKGTSFGRVKEVFKGLDEHHEKECLTSGLASGEGLLWHIRDSVTTKKKEILVEDVGVTDKRLLIFESEFAQVLNVQGREGNTLSSFIRNLWDIGTAQSLTKTLPIKTTNAHVSIIGHITQTELLLRLNEVETANGYANRFLFVCVQRTKYLALGSEISQIEVGRLKDRITDAMSFARSKGQINFSIEASKLWVLSYQRLETGRFGFLAKITQRASPYVLRLALIFALLDKSPLIEIQYLEAALSVWKYSEDSARYVFGDRLENPTAETILNALKERQENGLSRTEIRDLFERNRKKYEIDLALQFLLEANLARKEKQPTRSKSKEMWFAIGYDQNDQNDKSFPNV